MAIVLTDSPPPLPWYSQIAVVAPKDFLFKGVFITLFISLFFSAYFYLLKNQAYPVTVMPTTRLDRWIEFQPSMMPLYLSLWVYVSLPPLFMATRPEFFAYGRAMALACLVGLLIFYFWPTVVPVSDIDWARYPGIEFLKRIDAAGNALPSLHVATAVVAGIWLHRLLYRFAAPVWLAGVNAIWCVGIIYSTVATRQHVLVDVASGILLGGMTVYFSSSRRTEST
jgi:membrane-associated phospholipid phosphatase